MWLTLIVNFQKIKKNKRKEHSVEHIWIFEHFEINFKHMNIQTFEIKLSLHEKLFSICTQWNCEKEDKVSPGAVLDLSVVSVSAETLLSKYYRSCKTHAHTNTLNNHTNQMHVKWELTLPGHCQWNDRSHFNSRFQWNTTPRNQPRANKRTTHRCFQVHIMPRI